MFKFLPLLWASLQRHKLRTAFTLASVMIAFLLFGVLAAVKNGFSAGVETAGADRLMSTHKASFIFSLPLSYWARMRATAGVQEVTHATWFGGVYQDDSNIVQTFPVDPESYLKVYSDYKVSAEDRARWAGDRGSALIGRAYAKKFKWQVGDHVPLKSNIYRRANGGNTWEITIAGIFDAPEGMDTQQILFHYDYFAESLAADDSNRGQVGWYILKINVPDQAASVAAAVDALFANSPAETKTTTEKAFVQAFASQAGNIGAIVVAIASAVFFTMMLVTANTMAQSVRERSAEIGVLKTLGFSDQSVLFLVLGESVLITALGGFVGLGLAALMVQSMGTALAQYISGFFLNAQALILGVSLTLILGLVSGAMPAVRALRLRIVDALRQE
jgi:putative ABC transport system permease protein